MDYPWYPSQEKIEVDPESLKETPKLELNQTLRDVEAAEEMYIFLKRTKRTFADHARFMAYVYKTYDGDRGPILIGSPLYVSLADEAGRPAEMLGDNYF